MNTSSHLFKTISSCLVLTMLVMVVQFGYSSAALAQTSYASEGRSFGRGQANNDAKVDARDDGTRTFSYTDSDGNPVSIEISNTELWGGESVGGASDWQNMSNLYGDDAGISSAGAAEHSNMSSGTDSRSSAYGTYQDGRQMSRPDMSNDPIMAHSSRVFEGVHTGNVDCAADSPSGQSTQVCHRSNMMTSCGVRRDVSSYPISKVQVILKTQGCFDRSYMSLKVMFDDAEEQEYAGYLLDRASGTRYDLDSNQKMPTVPDHLFARAPDEDLYPHLKRNSGGSRQGLYGIFPEDIQSAYPELNFEYGSTRGNHWNDRLALNYAYFNPVDTKDFTMHTAEGTVVPTEINVSIDAIHRYRDGGGIKIIQQPTEDNDWTVVVRLDDSNSGSGSAPACPTISAISGNTDVYAGGDGTAWGDVTLTANLTGYVLYETIRETPDGCVDNPPAGCSWNFQCDDNEPREFQGYENDELRQKFTSMYPGDNPQDTSQPVCYSASATTSCQAESYGYDPAMSCSSLESNGNCGFESTKCAAYQPDGKCAYFEDTYNCAINPNNDPGCEIRKALTEEFTACERETTMTETSRSERLDDVRSCEIIYDLTSCQRTRSFPDPGDTSAYRDNDFPAEADNNPCIDSPGEFVKEANWTCNSRIPISDPATAPPPLFPGDDGSCVDATVQYNTEWYYQQMECYTDYEGNEQCPEGNAGNVNKNTCTEHVDNGCKVISGQCVEDAKDPNGFCFVEEYEYDCGRDVEVKDKEFSSEWSCEGDVQCMGTSCWSETDESNQSFGEALAYMNALQFAGQDSVCDAETGQCILFPGEALECKKALGGYQDCCDQPDAGPSLPEFLLMLYTVGKRTGAIETIDIIQGTKDAGVGAWKAMGKPGEKFFSDITEKYFTTAEENIAGSAGATMTDKTAEFVGEYFGDAVRDFFFETTSGQAGEQGATYATQQWVQTAGTYMGYVMTAYAIYSAIVLAVQIVFKCEEEEFNLATKRRLRSCTKVGSYCAKDSFAGCIEKRESFCCYSSPLARILNEQAQPQLGGGGFGSPKNPSCGGMTMGEFAGLDWSQIDLSEWIAMLTEAEMMPDGDASDMAQQYSMEALTGSGSTMAAGGDRDTALERSMERQPDDPDDSYRDMERSISGQE